MNTELLGVLATYLITVALAIPLGRYRAGVFSGGRSPLAWMAPVEKKVLHFCGIRADQAMDWKQFLKALLTINMLWFVYAFFVLIFQDKLPLNPDGNPGQTPDLRSDEHTSELQSLMRISYAVFCL